jgi:hypothetical protein
VRFKGRSSSAAPMSKLRQCFRTRTDEVYRPRTSSSAVENLVMLYISLCSSAIPQNHKMS